MNAHVCCDGCTRLIEAVKLYYAVHMRIGFETAPSREVFAARDSAFNDMCFAALYADASVVAAVRAPGEPHA